MKYIALPCRPDDDLNWQKQIHEAENEEMVCWQLDMGLEEGNLDFFHEAKFQMLVLCLDEFTKKIYQTMQDKTAGVVLYWGKASIVPLENDAFLEHLEESGQDKELFSIKLFSEYLHRLLSFLPDEIKAFAVLTGSETMTPARREQFFSKEKFPYLIPCFDVPCFTEKESSKALIIPNDEDFTDEAHQIFNELYMRLGPVRYIPESLLAECWDNLDEIYLIDSALSKAGNRMVTGFLAAGGTAWFASKQEGEIKLIKQTLE